MLWTFPVLAVSYVNWPTHAGVSDAEVNKRLSPADQSVLSAAKLAGNPIVARVDVEGHILEFTSSTSKGEMTRIADDFYRALQQALRIRRATFVAESLAAWTIPAAAFLYALGWAVGWIRSGFRRHAIETARLKPAHVWNPWGTRGDEAVAVRKILAIATPLWGHWHDCLDLR